MKENELLDAVYMAVKEVKGSYAIAVLNKKEPNNLVVARNGSPLIIGLEKKNYVASDIHALIQHTNKFVYLEDGDLATVTFEEVKIFDQDKKIFEGKQKKVV